MFKFVLASLFLCCLCSEVVAQDAQTKAFEAGANNFVSEALACQHYFLIAASGMEGPGDANTPESQRVIKAYKKGAEKMMMAAFATAQQINMTNAGLLARGKLVGEELKALMNNSMTNFSVLAVRYGDLCKAIHEKPWERIRTLANKELGQNK
ncbi:MAG: hypothetical protein ACR2PA_09730 [Hyphomicrobiaceae bacterium]